MSIYDKIAAGHYNSPKYPAKPKESGILRKNVKDLTDAEIGMIPEARKLFAEATKSYEAQMNTYRAETQANMARFQADLEEEHGLVGHPKAALVYSKAYDRGHSGGFSEVASAYEDYAELVR